jgi:hypothetical protein
MHVCARSGKSNCLLLAAVPPCPGSCRWWWWCFLKKKGFCDLAKVANLRFFLMLNFKKMGNFQKNMKYYSVTIFSICCQTIAKILKIICFKTFRHIWSLIYSFVAFFLNYFFAPFFSDRIAKLGKRKNLTCCNAKSLSGC